MSERPDSGWARWAGALTDLVTELGDLVLPGSCAGCAAERVPLSFGVCAGCVRALQRLEPYAAAPEPVPPGLPPCTAVGPYGGALRGVLLAYKERGRHRLAGPLGALLATAVDRAARVGGPADAPVLLVPVPSTAGAVRRRRFDHMARLAAHAARRLRAAGRPVAVAQPLRALPREDSAVLDAPGRMLAAESSLRIRRARIARLQRCVTMGYALVLVDDILTTGATLATVADRLTEADVHVTGAAVLAATHLRTGSGGR